MWKGNDNMKNYIKLLRVSHYAKNSLLFLPLIFSGNLFKIKLLFLTLIGFVMFSFLSSIIYINNDIEDIENDKKHPKKKFRPLPSGLISITKAKVLRFILTIIVFLLDLVLYLKIKNIFIIIFPIIYFLVNLFYSKGLKNIAILDVVILVIGFLIRVLIGSVITQVELSNWLYLMIMFGSFYLGFGKRRNEIIKNGDSSRQVLKSYNKNFLDKNMYNCLTLCIVCYSMWATDNMVVERVGNNLLLWTIPLVMIIFMLYSLEIENDSFGDPVEVVLNNKKILLMVGVYGIIMFLILYCI